MSRGAPPLDVSAVLADALRSAFDAAGFATPGISRYIGFAEHVTVSPVTLPRLLRRTAGGSAIETLIRLFFIHVPVPREAAELALGPVSLASWAQAGVVAVSGDEVRSWVQIHVEGELRLCFDPADEVGRFEPDHVMGLSASTREVLNICPATARRVLDLGTGCGVIALTLATRADRLLATDVTPRAVAMAQLNARLNSVDHLTVATGHLFEPAGTERFDLITMNTPFVLTPQRQFVFRDSGDGEGLVRALLAGAPRHLEPGGTLRATLAWACVRGEAWQERVRGFLPPGHDAWVIQRLQQSAASYVESWVHESEQLRGDAYRDRVDAWTHYFEAQQVDAVGTGVVILRRRLDDLPGEPWFLATDGTEGADVDAGRIVDRVFASRDFLDATTDEALLACALRLAPEAGLTQEYAPSSGGWSPSATTMSMTSGFRYRVAADAHIAGIFGLCDGTRTLGEVADTLAATLGVARPDVDAPILAAARMLLGLGFMTPPGVS